MAIEIKTNNHYNFFLYRDEVPETILNDKFKYLLDEYDHFIKYKGKYYHLSEFSVIPKQSELSKFGLQSELSKFGFDGYMSDSFFSGLVIKVSENNESYKIGTYFS